MPVAGYSGRSTQGWSVTAGQETEKAGEKENRRSGWALRLKEIQNNLSCLHSTGLFTYSKDRDEILQPPDHAAAEHSAHPLMGCEPPS